MKLSAISSLVALAIAVPTCASVVARIEGEVADTPAKESVRTLSSEIKPILNYPFSLQEQQRSSPALWPWDPEVVTCYGTGTKARNLAFPADRAPIVAVIDDWCGKVIGSTVQNGQTVWARYDYGTFTVFVSGEAINGCSFVIDGNCNRLLRLPVDGCNTSGVNGKQINEWREELTRKQRIRLCALNITFMDEKFNIAEMAEHG
ncbi:hypothetical protein C8R45DRAFT_936307 [Mycena sanguinolenta]|nr:hypothetical protein C8R45DRAFT_936307 [Mycena sanguinolenta]